MEIELKVLKEISERNKYGESIIELSKEYGFKKHTIYKELKKAGLNNGKKKYNKYDLTGEFGVGYATNTQDVFYFDLEDYGKIKDFAWYYNKKTGNGFYMENKYKCNSISLHRLIINAKKGEYVDHINRNTLDNRKENLRVCTNQQNGFNCTLKKNNTSGVSGVSWDKSRNKWSASIKYNYKNIYLGRFDNKRDAIIARLKKEKELFKEFSGQQHLFEEYGVGIDE
ncbi:HNH endonuclease [Clostridiaceae bacterium HSG29]|nr:HNH endonuclease [Clostridiaceae bacterium HSG29]